MPFLQHYFTSFYDPNQRQGGFRTKAASRELSSSMEQQLKLHNTYVLPDGVQEHDTAAHPVSLRYVRLSDDSYALINTTPAAKDESGRGGNFFAHAIVGNLDQFLTVEPISYFGHRMWVTNDPTFQEELPTIAYLPSPGNERSQAVLPMLRSTETQEHLKWLISAVQGYQGEPRKIVIVENANEVAKYIQLISASLPQTLRASLTFATYHHDVYRADGVIIGVDPSGSFGQSDRDYAQFLVLAPRLNRKSPLEITYYAEYVLQILKSRPHEQIEHFRDFVDRHLVTVEATTPNLDDYAHLYAVIDGPPEQPFAEEESLALDSLISRLGSLKTIRQGDINEALHIASRLRAGIEQGNSKDIPRYAIVGGFCSRHYPEYNRLLPLDIDVLADSIAKFGFAAELYSALNAVHGKENVAQALQSSPRITNLLEDASTPQALQSVWTLLGASLPTSWLPMKPTIAVLSSATATTLEPDKTSTGILNAIATSFAEREDVFLHAALAFSYPEPQRVLRWFYYALVASKPVESRSELRNLVLNRLPDMYHYEFARDLLREEPKNSLSVLDEWLSAGLSNQSWVPAATDRAISRAVDAYPAQDRSLLAQRIWGEDRYRKHLSTQTEGKLLELLFAELKVHPAAEEDWETFNHYREHPGIPEEIRQRMDVCMNLAGQNLTVAAVPGIQQQIKLMTDSDYRTALAAVLPHLLPRVVPTDELQHQYGLLVRGTYLDTKAEVFWREHNKALLNEILPEEKSSKRLLDSFRKRSTDEWNPAKVPVFVAVLDFWFLAGSNDSPELRYAKAEFFFHINGVLRDVLQRSGGKEFLESVVDQALNNGKSWNQSFFNIFNALILAGGDQANR